MIDNILVILGIVILLLIFLYLISGFICGLFCYKSNDNRIEPINTINNLSNTTNISNNNININNRPCEEIVLAKIITYDLSEDLLSIEKLPIANKV